MEGRGPDPRPFEPHGNGPAPPGPPFRTGGAVLAARPLLRLGRLDAAPARRELPVPDPGRRSAHPDAAHGRSVGGRRSAGVAADVRGRRRRARRCAGARGHLGPGAPPPLPDRPGAAPPAHSVRNRAALAVHPGRLVFPRPLRRRVRCRDGSQPSDGAGVRGAEGPRARSGPAGPRPAGPGASATVRAPAAARGKGGPRRKAVTRSRKRRPGAGRARRGAGGRDAGDTGRVRWLPFDELLAAAGSPALRDPRTLAALALAARSDILAEWRRPSEPEREAAPRQVGERRVRLSDFALRPPILDLDRPGPEHFLNGDLSLIEFNGRVLELAEDPSVPLLARIRFLSILSANLDEFFMVRVGTLKRAAASGGPVEEELHAIAIRVRALLERQARCFRDVCLPALAAHGGRILP